MDASSWLSLTSVLAVGAVSLLAYWIWKSLELFKTFEKMGLPGPPPNILMGNSRQMMKKGAFDIFTEWQRQYGKVYGVYLPRQPTIVISDLEMLRDLMVKKFAFFPNRASQPMMEYKPWVYTLGMLKNDHWKHVRSQLSPIFSSGKLKKMMPAVSRVLQNLDKNLKEKAQTGEEVELKYFSGCYAMDTIAGAAYGVHVDSLANPKDPFNVNALQLFSQNSWLIPLLFQFPWLTPVLLRLGLTFIPVKPTQFFLSIVESALEERRKDQQSHSDYLQLLVDAEKEGDARGPVDAEIDHSAHLTTSGQWTKKGLDDDEVKANALMFFLAGFEGTSIGLSFTLFQLAANPEALKKAQDEVDEKLASQPVRYDTVTELTYLDMCLNETLRLHPPGFLLDREAAEDVEIGGYQVKKGMKIMVPVYTIHRDPEYWPEPDKFLPERHTPEAKAARHPFAFMPFGYGPRNCIGMRLAQLEIRMALATVLQCYTPVLCDKSVYPPKIDPPQMRMLANDGLWVKFKPRD